MRSRPRGTGSGTRCQPPYPPLLGIAFAYILCRGCARETTHKQVFARVGDRAIYWLFAPPCVNDLFLNARTWRGLRKIYHKRGWTKPLRGREQASMRRRQVETSFRWSAEGLGP